MASCHLIEFTNLKKTYASGVDITCTLAVKKEHAASTWDWVGLYKLGWLHRSNYVTYQYVKLPDEHGVVSLVFPARDLPKPDIDSSADENEFQFVYIGSGSKMCGMSSTFKFYHPRADDFVDEEEDGIMVVRSREEMVAEKIQALEQELDFKVQQLELTKGRLALLEKDLRQRETIIQELHGKFSQLETKVSEQTEKRVSEMKEREEMEKEISAMKEQISTMNVEKNTAEQIIQQKSSELNSMKLKMMSVETNMKDLQSEKDEITGKYQNLQTELETFQEQLLTFQSEASRNLKKENEMTINIHDLHFKIERLEFERNCLLEVRISQEQELRAKEVQVETLKLELSKIREEECDLKNELHNANDKLMASEAVKTKLVSDLEAYEMTQQMMNDRLENSVSELRTMQDRLKSNGEEMQNKNKENEAKAAELAKNECALEDSEKNLKDALLKVDSLEQQKKELLDKQSHQTTQMDVMVAKMQDVSDDRNMMCEQMRMMAEELNQMKEENKKVKEDQQAAVFASKAALEELTRKKDAEVASIRQDFEMNRNTLIHEHKEVLDLTNMVEDLQARLQLGKLEYTEKAKEVCVLTKMIQKQAEQLQRSAAKEDVSLLQSSTSPAPQGGTTDDAQAEVLLLKNQVHEKDQMIEQLQKELKRANDEHLLKQLEKEERINQQLRTLTCGNPYARPSQQTVIKSTLESDDDEDDAVDANTALVDSEKNNLPPPLQPQVLGACCGHPDADDTAQEIFEDCANTMSDDSFMDAIGEEMKICPFCETNCARTNFEEHVATHFGRICPVCKHQADDSMSAEGFEQHVNTCLDREHEGASGAAHGSTSH